MNKKLALVTGVTSGVGKAVALELVQIGYDLIVIARNESKFQAFGEEALSINKDAIIDFFKADLSLVSSTSEALAQIKAKYKQVDLVFQSAGLVPSKIELSEEGIEKTFAVSYLTKYLITQEMLPLLLTSDDKLIFTIAGPGGNGTIYFDDINFSKTKFSFIKVVKQFQQANDAYLMHLSEKYDDAGVRVYCYHPGLVDTQIHEGWPPVIGFIMRNIIRPILMHPPEKAAQTPLQIISGSLEPDGTMVDYKGKTIQPSEEIVDNAYQQKVIGLSERLVSSTK